jgi:hypothetical protein
MKLDLLIGIVLSAAIGLLMIAERAHGATPDSPRMERQFPQFMDGLFVPPAPPSVISRRFAEALTDPLAGFGNAQSSLTHCCGVADCRFVQSRQDVPDAAVIKDTPPGVREPMSAVLCGRYNTEGVASEVFVYCFHPARDLGWWTP